MPAALKNARSLVTTRVFLASVAAIPLDGTLVPSAERWAYNIPVAPPTGIDCAFSSRCHFDYSAIVIPFVDDF